MAKALPSYWHQARRRFLLKSYGTLYTALMDAASIFGNAIWRLRRRVQRKPDTDPPSMLLDSIRHRLLHKVHSREVENPAMCTVTPIK